MPKKLTIGHCKELAELYGGRCLSDTYICSNSTYLWECQNKHIFLAKYSNVYSGKWCKECYNDKIRLKCSDIINILDSKGIGLLSDVSKYKNSKTTLSLLCIVCGNKFRSTLDTVKKYKSGCPMCSVESRSSKRKYSIDRAQKICEKHGCRIVGKYSGISFDASVRCLECGNCVTKNLMRIKRNGFNCPECQRLRTKLAHRLRTRLNHAIKNDSRSGSAVRDLGCSIDEFKTYLEKKFYPNPDTGEVMSWDNWSYNGWHIDHIKPLASFDLSDIKQFLKSCHYTNLQPLWSKDNIKKGAKL